MYIDASLRIILLKDGKGTFKSERENSVFWWPDDSGQTKGYREFFFDTVTIVGE